MQGSIFDEIRGVWIADETLPRVFDISSQSKQKLKNKRRNESLKSMLIDHFTVVDLVIWPLYSSEAGVDLVLIHTSLFLLCKSSCSYAN